MKTGWFGGRALGLLLLGLFGQAAVYVQQPEPSQVWIAFRYDAERVLFYVHQTRDPIRQDVTKALPAPQARFGSGGYLLPLESEHLRRLLPATQSMPDLGQSLTLRLGGDGTIAATAAAYVEQWGSENPLVRIGILARVAAQDLPIFRAASSDYFLVSETKVSVNRQIGASRRAVGGLVAGTVTVLNEFDSLGELVLTEAAAGWSVRLFTRAEGVLRPTAVVYHYGD